MENINTLKNFYKDKKVLVTGHTGFKGSWLCMMLLELGANIMGISLRPEKESIYNLCKLTKKITSHYIDIRNYDLIEKYIREFKPEIVIHMAAQPLVLQSYQEPRYTFDVNIMGTCNILEIIRHLKTVKSVINVTTDKVYKNKEEKNYSYKEDDKLDGYDPYSNSKSCSELITSSYINSYFNDLDIRVSTVRAGNVIGGGDFSSGRILPDVYRSLLNNEEMILRHPNSIRPYQHVFDVNFFYILLAYKQFNNKKFASSYNIGPGFDEVISNKQILELYKKFNPNFKYIVKNINTCHEANYLRLDITKIRQTFKFRNKFNVRQAIKKTCLWHQTYLDNHNIEEYCIKEIKDYLYEN